MLNLCPLVLLAASQKDRAFKLYYLMPSLAIGHYTCMLWFRFSLHHTYIMASLAITHHTCVILSKEKKSFFHIDASTYCFSEVDVTDVVSNL